MRQKKHGFKVRKFSLYPTGNNFSKLESHYQCLFSGIIRRMIFAIELFLKAMAYLTSKREPESRTVPKSKYTTLS